MKKVILALMAVMLVAGGAEAASKVKHHRSAKRTQQQTTHKRNETVVVDDSNVLHNDEIKSADDGEEVFEQVEEMPVFPGGLQGLMGFLSENVQYPDQAIKEKVEGRVVVRFVVTATGEVGDAIITRSLHPALDAEAIRVVKSLPRFEPGRQNGQAVNVWLTLPITFKLPK